MSGFRGRCVNCRREYRRGSRRPEPPKPQISAEDVAQKLEAQGFRCAICERGLTLPSGYDTVRSYEAVVDCDATGNLRAMLCAFCSRVLGYLARDVDRARKVVNYLATGSHMSLAPIDARKERLRAPVMTGPIDLDEVDAAAARIAAEMKGEAQPAREPDALDAFLQDVPTASAKRSPPRTRRRARRS